MTDKIISIYVDSPIWAPDIKIDDFIITEGKKKTNSVYHVLEVRIKLMGRKKRSHLKCYYSDLITAIKRGPEQNIIPMTWYSRNKKK